MSNPVGMRVKAVSSLSGGAVHVYSSSKRIVLQVRRDVPTELDLLGASFKSAVELQPADALALAGELLAVAGKMLAGGRKDVR